MIERVTQIGRQRIGLLMPTNVNNFQCFAPKASQFFIIFNWYHRVRNIHILVPKSSLAHGLKSRCAHLPIHWPSQTQLTQEKTTHFTTVYLFCIPSASKRYSSVVLPQLDGGVFPTFVAKRQRTYKSQKVLQNRKNKRSFGEIKY